MSYRLTEILYRFRKVVRQESRKGDLKKLIFSALISQGLVVIYFIVPIFGATDQLLLQKSIYYLRGDIKAPNEVAIISIDDKTFKDLSLSSKRPIPRWIMADAVTRVQEDKPKLVVLDMFTSVEPEELEATKKLADALKLGPSTIAKGLPLPIDENNPETLKAKIYPVPSEPLIMNATSMPLEMTTVPFDIFGYYKLTNRISKSSRFSTSEMNEAVPLLSALKKYVNPDLKEPGAYDLINYYGEDQIKSYSLGDLVSDKKIIPKGLFKDKIVFFGFKTDILQRGTTNKEIITIPYASEDNTSSEMFGVEIHATILSNLLTENWIRKFDITTESLILAILFCICNVGILLLNPRTGLFFITGFLSVWFIFSYVCFVYFNLFIPGFYMLLLTSPIVFGGSSCIIATQALKELKETKAMLGMKEKHSS